MINTVMIETKIMFHVKESSLTEQAHSQSKFLKFKYKVHHELHMTVKRKGEQLAV